MIRFMGEDTVDVPLWGDRGLMFSTPEECLEAFGPLGLTAELVTQIVAWARAWQTDSDTPEHDAEAVRLVRQLATELEGVYQIAYVP
jgi:hypothetical protein